MNNECNGFCAPVYLSGVFLLIYFFLMYQLFKVNVWDTPYIFLTMYFIISFLTFPYIDGDKNTCTIQKDTNIIKKIGAFIVAPILTVRRMI